MIKAVVFDLDDTLISEKEYMESGYRYIAKRWSSTWKISEQAIFNKLIELSNVSTKYVFNRLLEYLGFNDTQENIMDLVMEYRNHLPNIHFFDDVIPCFQQLKEQKIQTGIITDGYANAQRQKLRAVNAYDYIDEIIVTDELGTAYWKPHPKSFELMREMLQVEFDEMIYVGDNPEKDFFIGSIYPLKTIRILREGIYSKRSYFNNIKENYTINSLSEVHAIVHQLAVI